MQAQYLYTKSIGEQFYIDCEIHGGKHENRYVISYKDPIRGFKEVVFAYPEQLQLPKFSEYGAL